MGHVQHLSLESLVKMDHFQKEPPLNLKRDHWGTRGVERGQCLKEQTGNPAQTEMSPLGQKQTYAVQKGMSALPPKADMCGALADVCYGPIADIDLSHNNVGQVVGLPHAYLVLYALVIWRTSDAAHPYYKRDGPARCRMPQDRSHRCRRACRTAHRSYCRSRVCGT